MKQIYQDLWQTKLEIPFSSVHAHAYFLESSTENVLVYNTGHAEELDEMASRGGIGLQILSHRDEAGESLNTIRQRFGSKLLCHEIEAPAIADWCVPDITISDDQLEIAGLQVFHTPGHTAGSISFLYESITGQRYLFSGDTLFQTHDEWQTLVIPAAGGNAVALETSLLIYRDLKPDVVLWSASGGGKYSYAEVNDNEWKEAIDAVILKIRQ